MILLVATGVIISAAAGFFLLPRVSAYKVDKSIAVLPFENLSKDEENAFFAGGVQDEILTNLAKVADLKVISRTSVMKYKSGLERNLREIANTLGVSHVVEGSVQRAAGRVRVNVQLIDARNDAHFGLSITIAMLPTSLPSKPKSRSESPINFVLSFQGPKKPQSPNARPQIWLLMPITQKPRRSTSSPIGRVRKKVRSKKWNCSKKPRSAIRILPWPIASSRKRNSTSFQTSIASLLS